MSDGGRYTGPQIGWTDLGNTIVDENTGDIMVFATSLKAGQIIYRSKDNGKTWKTENILIKPDVNGWISCPNMACDPGVTLKYGKRKGRLLVPSRVFWDYVNKSKGEKIFDKHYSNAIYSDDGGKTWIPSAPFPLAGTGEAGLVELRDGTIYYNSRTHDVVASKDNLGNRVILKVVNRSADKDISTQIVGVKFKKASAYILYTENLDLENTLDQPEKVTVVKESVDKTSSGATFTFKKHSANVLVFEY